MNLRVKPLARSACAAALLGACASTPEAAPLAAPPPPSASLNPSSHATASSGAQDCAALERAVGRAETMRDLAAAYAVTPVGEARAAIERLLVNAAPRVAMQLRYGGADLRGELSESVREVATGLNAIAQDATRSTLMAEHLDALDRALHHLAPLCPVADFSKPVRPPLSPEAVSFLVLANQPRFTECRVKGPAPDGQFAIRILIQGDGSVERVTDDGGAVPDRDVRACVLDAVKAIRFPPFRGRMADYGVSIVLKPPS